MSLNNIKKEGDMLPTTTKITKEMILNTAFEIAREKGFEKIVVLCKSADRGAVKLSGSLGVKISFEKSRDIYKKLLKASLLPELTFEKKPEKFSLSDVLELVFQKQNIMKDLLKY